MDRLQRMLFLATTVAMLGVATNALAEWGEPGCGPDTRKDGKQMAQMRERRAALLHDSLQLTPEQEKAWATFAAKRNELHPADHADLAALHAPERMEKMLERLREHEARMSKMLEALKEFYAVLNPKQQKIFDEFMPAPGRHEHPMH